MAYQGKTQLIIVIVATPDQVDEGERIFRSHAPWMKAAHPRDGDKALLTYNVSKAPEISNPMASCTELGLALSAACAPPEFCAHWKHLLHRE